MSYRSQTFCCVTAGILLIHGNSLAGPSQWFFSGFEYLHKMVAGQLAQTVPYSPSNNPELIDTLISLGACIEDEDCSGDSALLVAARSGAQEAFKRLSNRGAKIDAKNFENHTALSLAARYGHMHLVAILLGMGLKDYDEALIETFDGGHTNVARLLIQAGATIESNTQANNPLLLQLLPHVWPSMIRLFLRSGAHPNHVIHGERSLIRMLNYVGHTWQSKLAKKTPKGLYAWLSQLRNSVDIMLNESDAYSELLQESAKQCIENARAITPNDQQRKQLHTITQCQKTIKWLLSLLFAKTLYEFSSRGAHPLSDQKWQQIYRDLKSVQPLAKDRVMARQLQAELKRIQPLFRERVVARQNEINAFLLKYDVSQVVTVLIKQLDGGPMQPITSV